VSYNALLKKLNVYDAFDNEDAAVDNVYGQAIDNANASASVNFNAAGKMYIGNDASGAKAFKGYIHDFRVWEKEIDFSTSAANSVVNLNGDEIGLSGFWPMNELKGAFSTDLSRGHHAFLTGPTWRVLPSGYAYKFDGSTAVDMTTAPLVVISKDMDFTIEMWFKADASQKSKVLFSNGMTDGTDASAIDSIWEIGIDNNGLIYAQNNGERVLQETGSFIDDQWHHLAVVKRSKSQTSIYLDGALNGVKHSSFFGGLIGSSMTLGASRNYSGGTYANFFTGTIDELRVWKLARTKELINLDRNAQLIGNEMGLVAYYPFDKLGTNLLLNSSKEDFVTGAPTNQLTALSFTEQGGTFVNDTVPNIQKARPVQNLNFNWIVNGDELSIDILEQPSLIEKRTIELTVENVADTNENLMASPETWTAYIKQNTVVWSDNVVDRETQQYTGFTFDVEVINTGAIAQNFNISNLPTWLTVSVASGTISPTSSQTITFTVGSLVNIGRYEEVMYLTTDFGYNEKLHVKIKVIGETSDWSIDPTSFQHSMSIIGQVSIDNVTSIDVDDILIALVNGEVRGIDTLKYYAAYSAYLVFMDVYSNSIDGETVTFHIWDESEGKEHTEVTPNIPFLENSVIGTPALPAKFNAVNTFYEPIIVRKGWNWISFPLKSAKHVRINELLGNINSGPSDIIKGISHYDQYTAINNIGWIGSLTGIGGVDNKYGYKLKTSYQDTIEYSGSKVDPLTVTIPINTGWNWLGFTSQKYLSINDAFTNYNPVNGDLLKSQYSFAIYDDLIGWQGSLAFLVPTKGYMFKSKADNSLSYPDAELFNYKTGPTLTTEELYAQYVIVPQNFQYNMSAIVDVTVCDYALEGEVLLAYADGEIRGAANIIANKAYLTIYGYAETATLTFKVKVSANEYFDAFESMDYVPNSQAGSLLSPFKLQANMTLADCDVVTGLSPPTEESFRVFPTLFNDQLRLEYTLQENAAVTIALYNLTGQKIVTLMSGSRLKGSHIFNWNKINENQKLSEGLYFLRINWEDKQVTKKVVKTNNR
jgi:hypothetical protein